MILTLTRRWPKAEAILGTLDEGGNDLGYTLEPAGDEIPLGRYRLVLTVSGRAQRGELWCPGADRNPSGPYVLPELLNVPGRKAIRIHSGNTAEDTTGCILVGLNKIGASISGSRRALVRLMEHIGDALDCWIEVREEHEA